MLETASDKDLAARAQTGDRAAFGVLVSRHHERVYGFYRSSGQAKEDAEDYCQETFLRAFKAIRRFDPRQDFLPWLFTIARREAIRGWRRKKPAAPLDGIGEIAGEDERATQDLAAHLWHVARRELSPAAYTALWLHYREDMPLLGIARSLGKSEGATKVLIHRARQKLRVNFDHPRLEAGMHIQPAIL